MAIRPSYSGRNRSIDQPFSSAFNDSYTRPSSWEKNKSNYVKRKEANSLNKQQLDAVRERQHNGQLRGDLGKPDKHDARYNYNTYKEDYFSGVQCKLYMGDIWLDDVVTIQYNISQGKQPIYGYAAQNFDAVAMGTVIGNGSLTIAFKEVGYLNVVKAVLDQQKLGVNKAITNVTNRINNSAEDNISANINTTSSLKGRINPNMTPSLIRKEETIETILDNLKGVGVSPFNNNYSNINGNVFVNDKEQLDFEAVAEIFEDSIWGDSNGVPFGTMRNKILRADEFDYFYDRFITQGIQCAHSDDDYGKVLNLMLTFGDINDFRAEHTLIVLNDVHFTGQGLISAPNGEPIAETYSFFFRDINKSVSQSTWGTMNPLKFHIGTDNPIDLARLKDVEKIEEFIDSYGADVTIKILSTWDGNVWTPLGTKFDASLELQRMFKIDGVGASQSLNNYIEESMQIFYTKNQLKLRPLKVAIEVRIEPLTSSAGHKFNYILEQHGADTSLYKVISPTRDDFHSLNLVRREDFFSATPPVEDDKAPSLINNSSNQKTDDAFVPTSEIEGLPYKESDLMKETYKHQAYTNDIQSMGFEPTETDINNQIKDLQSQLDNIENTNESNYTNNDNINKQDKTIIVPDSINNNINYSSWQKQPEGEYYIGVSDDFKEHETGLESGKHKSQGIDTVYYDTKERKALQGQQLPFESQVLYAGKNDSLLTTPYKYGKDNQDVALYLYHYDITNEYKQGDIIPERKFFGEFKKTDDYQKEHAHWQVQVKNNSTGKYEQLSSKEMAYLYNTIFGSNYNIYSDQP